MDIIRNMCICGKGEVVPANIFETVTAGKKFYNAEMKCDFAGNKIAEMVEKGEVDVNVAINEILTHAQHILKGNKKSETHMLAWMCMHLSLGLCQKFDIKDRAMVRHIMQELLPLSKGVDNGIYFRDVVAFGEDGQFLDANEKEMLQKAMYYLRMAANFNINMQNEEYARSIYGHVTRKIPQSVNYIDLPLGNPAFALGTAPPSRNGPLQTAVEGMKPHAVLTLLRYGANPHGEPLNFVLASLSSAKTVEEKTKHKIANNPVEQMKLILKYLLRSVNQLRLRFDDQKIGDMDHDEDVYFVSKNIENFLEEKYYNSPNNLKQLCRTYIRNAVSQNDALPEGLYTFKKPLITTHHRYLDLLS